MQVRAAQQPDAADEAGAAAGRLAPSSQLIRVLARLREVASGTTRPLDETPEQILKRRYARGEIEREEYQRRLEDLRR